jgi:thioredoxin-like negative regulator of GroEL
VIELTEKQLQTRLHEEAGPLALFFYTPLCGTCKLTERMLNIILEMSPSIPLSKCNLNLMPMIVQTWKIESAPCLIVYENGEVIEKVYAMQSVDYLYRLLQSLCEK